MTKHNRTVARLARSHKRRGWNVQADIPGYPTPSGIGRNKRIPDLVATKPGSRRIIEVETQSSLGSDKDQLATFRRSAAQRRRTKFGVVIAK